MATIIDHGAPIAYTEQMRLYRGEAPISAILVLLAATPAVADVVSRAEMLSEERAFDEAIPMLETYLDTNRNDAAAWRALGRTFLACGRWDDAIKAQEQAVELRPDDVEFRLSLAKAYREKARRSGMISGVKNAKKWKAQLELCVNTWPENVEGRRWLVRYLLHAPGFGGGDKDRALALAAETMQYEAYEGRLLIAYSHRLRDELDAAIAMYDSCVSIYPDSARTWGEYAYTLLVAERVEPALPLFETWASVAPDDPEALAGLGDWAVAAGLHDEAEVAYRHALEVDPYYSQARYDLALMLEEDRRYPEARLEYSTIVELTPEFLSVGDAKKRAYRLKRKK